MGISVTESFCLEYLTGTTRLLEIQKELLFSLSILSSCRELPVFLSIKKLLTSFKKKIHTKLWLLTPSSAIPTWLIPQNSILTSQHYGYDSKPYKLDLI